MVIKDQAGQKSGISNQVLREARSKRLKCVRDMTSLSRRQFSERYQIKQGTLQNWENARFGGLTENGALKMIECFKQEGIYCTLNWLMSGIGPEPKVIGDVSNKAEVHQRLVAPERQSLTASDITAMLALHPKAISMVINDDSMMPLLKKGSHVMGNKCFGADIAKHCCRRVCIVETRGGVRLVRLLMAAHEQDRYHLMMYNPESKVNPSCLLNVELAMAAPVFWTRIPN